MNVSKILSLGIMGATAYTQQDTIEDIIAAPIEMTRIVRCKVEVTSIQRVVIADVLTDDLPRDALYNFSGYLRKRLLSNSDRDVSLDPWGNPYKMRIYQNTEYEIWSYGPDQENDTSDDIWASVPLP